MKKYMDFRYKNGVVIINYEVAGIKGYRMGKGVGDTARAAKRAILELLKVVA